MGKFAGFLKHMKKIADIGSGILGGINDIYKGIKPLVNTSVGFLPGGSFINQGLDIASNVVDKIQPYTKNWINESDHNRIQSINDNIKRVGGNVAKSLLDKYHESIFGKSLNLTSDIFFVLTSQKNMART